MARGEIDLRGHLDREHLSALVDGTACADTRAHLTGCRRCRDRLQAWKLVRDRIAALDDDRARRVLDNRRGEVVAAVTSAVPVPGRSRRGWRLRGARRRDHD